VGKTWCTGPLRNLRLTHVDLPREHAWCLGTTRVYSRIMDSTARTEIKVSGSGLLRCAVYCGALHCGTYTAKCGMEAAMETWCPFTMADLDPEVTTDE
jgi:hypothetical protein